MTNTTLNVHSKPAMVDPPVPQHPVNNPCFGCPRWRGADFTSINLDHETACAYWGGVDVELTLAEFRVVKALVEAHGEYITFRQLYAVYKGSSFNSGQAGANMRSAVKRIRNKFKRFAPGWDYIQAYPKFGYGWRKGSLP